MRNYECTRQETGKKIIFAFWELYKTNTIEKITVKMITDACGIYRTTFYLHFSDVYAVLERIEDALLDELKAVRGTQDTPMNKEEYMRRLEELIEKQYVYLSVLLDNKKHPEFAKKYKEELVYRICENYDIHLERMEEKERTVISGTISMLVEIFFNWIEQKLFSFHEAAALVEGYLDRGILKTLDETGGTTVNTRLSLVDRDV